MTNTVQHQHVRRDRPGHRHHARCSSRPTSSSPARPRPPRVAADNAARGVVLDDGASQHRPPGTPPAPAVTTAAAVAHRRANPVRVGAGASTLTAADGRSSTSATTSGSSSRTQPGDRRPAPTVATFANTRTASRPRRGRRPQARDVQRAELLHHHGRGVRTLAHRRRLHPLQRPRTATRSRSTPAPRTARAAPGNDANLAASRTRSSARSTPWTPTSSAWRRSRTPSPLGEDRDDAVRQLVAALNTAAGSRAGPSPRRRRGDLRRSPSRTSSAPPSSSTRPRSPVGRPVGGAGRQRRRSPTRASRWPRRSRPRVRPTPRRSPCGQPLQVQELDRRTGRQRRPGDGQGAFNGDRIRQADGLRRRSPTRSRPSAASSGLPRGRLQLLHRGGPDAGPRTAPGSTPSSPTPPDETSPTASPACPARSTTSSPTRRPWTTVTGADIWDINANESIAYRVQPLQLQRHQLPTSNAIYASSDHNPEVVGIDVRATPSRRSRSSAPTTSTAGSPTTRPGRGRCRGAGRRGQAAPGGEPRTRCSRRPVT